MLAIEAENLEMLELLIVMGVETKDALLHAIDQEFVEAVELLLEYEELLTNEMIENCESKLMFPKCIMSRLLHKKTHNYKNK